jgi:hypothetical protein
MMAVPTYQRALPSPILFGDAILSPPPPQLVRCPLSYVAGMRATKTNGLLPRGSKLTFRLPVAARKELEAVAFDCRRPASDIVAQVIADWLVQHGVVHGYRSEATP